MDAVFPRPWAGAGRRSVLPGGRAATPKLAGCRGSMAKTQGSRRHPADRQAQVSRSSVQATALALPSAPTTSACQRLGAPTTWGAGTGRISLTKWGAGQAGNQKVGGLGGNRTPVQGFAVLCVTTPPRGLCRAAPWGHPATPVRAAGSGRAVSSRGPCGRATAFGRSREKGCAGNRAAPGGPERDRAGRAKKCDGIVKSPARTPLRPGRALCRPPIAVPDSSVGRASDC